MLICFPPITRLPRRKSWPWRKFVSRFTLRREMKILIIPGLLLLYKVRVGNSHSFWQFYSLNLSRPDKVHNRPQYYENLIDSLKKSVSIENVHLIISSDYWSPGVAEVTKKVDFCQVTHIYYPLSASFYEASFPADSPSDCHRNTALSKEGVNCTFFH